MSNIHPWSEQLEKVVILSVAPCRTNRKFYDA